MHLSFGNGGADAIARWSAVALCFTLPISTAADSLLTALIVLFWLLGGRYREKFATIRASPVALWALALYGLFILGSLYGLGGREDALHYLGKYKPLLLIPLLIPLFRDARDRRLAIDAFLYAMGLTLALSYLIWLGWLTPQPYLAGTADDPVVFKLRITHGLFVAFAAYLFALRALAATRPARRALWWLAAAAAVFNVLFMVQGRTGYLTIAALAAYFLWHRLRWKGLLLAGFAGAIAAPTAYQGSATLRESVNLAVSEADVWTPNAGSRTSIGLRLDYLNNTVAIIRDHPIVGVGTGGFKHAYAEQIANSNMVPADNPHNQYLLITAQLGVVGLVVLLGLFAVQWRDAGVLSNSQEQAVAKGMLLAMMLGCLFNSFLLDHAEGLFYAWISGMLASSAGARQ